MIPYGRQDINQDDINAVIEVLQSDFLTQGPKVPEFERQVANYCGARFGVAVNSATSALHIACMALDIGPGDIVWTSPISFVASANCALYCGASVDFVDIDPETFNLSIAALAKKLEIANQQDRLPKALIPVHMAGQSCDMKAIAKLAQQYGFKIIEDASHAIGASYADTKVGCSVYSDMTVFSFHPVKIITSAEGGMVMTNDAVLNDKLQCFRSHGIIRDANAITEESHGPWYYEQVALGYNYRLSDMHAALGISQLSRLDQFISRRKEIASYYHQHLAELPLYTPVEAEGCASSWHLYIVRLHDDLMTRHREIFSSLRENGIGVQLHYIPIYRQPYYDHIDDSQYLSATEDYYKRAISIPISTNLTDDDLQRVILKLEHCLR